MPEQFAFVPSDELGRTLTCHRRTIRSRCMRGKNRRAGSRRSGRVVAGEVTIKAQNGSSVLSDRSSTISSGAAPRTEASSNLVSTNEAAEAARASAGDAATVLPCHRDLQLVPFAIELDSHSQDILSDILACKAIRNTASPLELCVDFQMAENSQLQWLLQGHDMAFLHATLLASCALHDFTLERPLSPISRFHLGRTLGLLNRKISNGSALSHDSTVYTMTTLAFMAAFAGDTSAAEAHLKGLQRVIQLHGGKRFLQRNPKLHFKIEYLELSLSLSTGTKKFSVSKGQPFGEDTFDARPPISIHVHETLDRRVAVVFQDFQQLVRSINQHSDEGTQLPGHLFQAKISSIRSRLMILEGTLTDDLSESLRLGLLVFLLSFVRLPGSKTRYARLAPRFRLACEALPSCTAEFEDLTLWLSMIGAISVFDPDEQWLRTIWCGCVRPEDPWEDVCLRLESVLWINCLHDDPGRKAFAHLMHGHS